jgi:beta-phosphoglucomutase-like phosphatase (HAD superfamily)
LTADMRARLDGKRNRDIFPILFERDLSEDDQRRFAEEKEAVYRELSRGRLAPLPGLVPLLDVLDRRRLPTALATSAPLENVTHTLSELGLTRRLTHVVRSDTVARGKPHPDVFLAARAAGMRCVALTTSFAAGTFAAHGAPPDAEVADFDAFLAGPGAWLLEADPV